MSAIIFIRLQKFFTFLHKLDLVFPSGLGPAAEKVLNDQEGNVRDVDRDLPSLSFSFSIALDAPFVGVGE